MKIPTANIYTVSRLNQAAELTLKNYFQSIWVEGEVSDLARPSSGHIYFTLKDNISQIRCVMFKSRQTNTSKQIQSGMQIIAHANVSIYQERGQFQLIIEAMQSKGEGLLQLRFNALKQKLQQEGLFDPKYKKPLPDFPQCIGIITSLHGAALQDILKVLKRRYPIAEIIIYAATIQGNNALQEIQQALTIANQHAQAEVLILARGGGSLEDFQPFNEEGIARAIHDSMIPIITGVGHETDFSIADFTADLQAPTPSVAAELSSPDQKQLSADLQVLITCLFNVAQQKIKHYHQELLLLNKTMRHPQSILQQWMQTVDKLNESLNHVLDKIYLRKVQSFQYTHQQLLALDPNQQLKQQTLNIKHQTTVLTQLMKKTLVHYRHQTIQLEQNLMLINPLNVLNRGYAIVRQKDKAGHYCILDDTKNLNNSDTIQVKLAKGQFESIVSKIKHD